MNFNVANLLSYQTEPAFELTQLLRRGQNVLDGSDMGTGKTAVACAVIRELNQPTLVLAPQISLTAWRRMGDLFGTEFDVLNPEAIQTGKTPFGTWEKPRPPGPLAVEYFCQSCQLQVDLQKPRPCPLHPGGIHCIIAKKKPHDYGKFHWHAGIRLLVVDEVHRFGALDSLNAKMLIAVKRQGIPVLAMSATVADSPLNLRALGYVLGLHKLAGAEGGFYHFIFRHGCKKHPFGGFYFGKDDEDRRQRMAKLHAEVFPSRGVRVRIDDLGDAFPAVQITSELFDLKSAGRLEALYAEMNEALTELRDAKLGDANAEHPLTKLLRARQEVEVLKVPLFEELAKQGVESGNSVAIFVSFKATVDELCKRLGTSCRIVGGQSAAERDAAIDGFQADKERIIVANTDAGGVSVSLHDTHGRFPRLGLVSPTFSSTKLRQVFGRLRRAGGRSKALYRLVLAAGTCEEKIHRAVSVKLDRLDALNDCDLMAANLPLSWAEWPTGL